MHWLKVSGKRMSHMQARLRSVIWAALSVVTHALSLLVQPQNHLEPISWHVIPAKHQHLETMHSGWLLYNQNTYLELPDICLSVKLPPQWTEDHHRAPAEKKGLEGLTLELGSLKVFLFLASLNQVRHYRNGWAKNEKAPSCCNKSVWLIVFLW